MSASYKQKIELIVFGYVRLNYKENIIDDIIKICLNYYSKIEFIWDVFCNEIAKSVSDDGILNAESNGLGIEIGPPSVLPLRMVDKGTQTTLVEDENKSDHASLGFFADHELYKWLSDKCGFKAGEALDYLQLFIKNGIEDIECVKLLKVSHLYSIGINKIGHRLKIMDQIEKLLNNKCNGEYSHFEFKKEKKGVYRKE